MNRITRLLAIPAFALIPALQASAQNQAKPEVLPQGAIVYSLPSTTLYFKVEADCEKYMAGPYAKYAQKYLGIVAKEASGETYRIKSVTMTPFIEADPSVNYPIIIGGSKTATANFLEFTNQGLLMWSDSYSGKQEKFRFSTMNSNEIFNEESATSNLTNEKTTLFKTVQTESGIERVPVQQTQVVEKSLEKKAEETAALIFKLRQKRLDIITGETDATFSGEAMKAAVDEINRLETQYLDLFFGKSSHSSQIMGFEVVPKADNTRQIYIAFRISESAGLLPPDNISGRPVVLEIKNDETKDNATMDLSNSKVKVIYYRKPAMVTARLTDGSVQLLQARVPVYQLGKMLSFPIDVATVK
jgi:hypothetical protein